MLVVRATKKLLDRLGPVTLESGQTSTTRLGDWYASAWAWRPQVALFVSEATLFPILMPLAPAATLLARVPDGLAQALAAHDVPEAFITQELSRMQEVRLGKTASRSVLGIMNEFTFLAQTMRGDTTTDLTDLARWLARTPCSPLFKRHGSPGFSLERFHVAPAEPQRCAGLVDCAACAAGVTDCETCFGARGVTPECVECAASEEG